MSLGEGQQGSYKADCFTNIDQEIPYLLTGFKVTFLGEAEAETETKSWFVVLGDK